MWATQRLFTTPCPTTSECLWRFPPTHPTHRFSKSLRESLRLAEVWACCRELPLLQPSPTCARLYRSSGLYDKGHPALFLKAPHLLRWCPATSHPRTQSAVTYRGCLWGGSRGEGCQPPYSIRSSSFRSCVLSLGGEGVDPTGSPSFLSRSWIFSYSLVILYQTGN